MGWGANQWLRLTTESTYGTFDSGGTETYIRLHTDNAFNMIPVPGRKEINSADGGNRPVQNVSSTMRYAGSLTTLLYPTQAAALLGWVATLTAKQLSSMSVDFYDSVRVRRYLGAKAAKATISCGAEQDEGILTLQLDLVAQTKAGSDPTFTEPAFSVFPTETPYTFQQSTTGFTVGGATRTKYNRFSCTITNKLAATMDELGYISGLNYCGRNVDFSTSFQYTANTDQGNYESQSALDCSIVFTHTTNALTLDFNTKGRMTKRSRMLPLGDVAREEYDVRCLYDSGASGDFSFSVA